MRFVLAIVSFVLAALMIGWGIGQRTIFSGSDHVQASVETAAAPLTVIDGAAIEQLGASLGAEAPSRSLRAEGFGPVVLAYGRTADVLAWVGETDHNLIGADAQTGELVAERVQGTERESPDPRGSDLWLGEQSGESSIDFTDGVRADMSVLLASDGVAAAPTEITVAWPVDNRTPWAVPLIVAGSVMLVLGLALYIWALVHLRRGQGPRRKTAKQPKGPKPPKRPKPGVLGAGKRPGPQIESPRGRRSVRKRIALLPAGLAVAVLAGCTGGPAQQTGASPAPSASASAEAAAELSEPPAVTQAQAERILADVAAVASAGDEARDAEALASRFEGSALEQRRGHYAVQNASQEQEAPPAFAGGELQLILPQATGSWPRTVFAVLGDPANAEAAQTAVLLTQASPREQYKVQYAMNFAPGAQFPDVAPASIGAARLSPDDTLLAMPPSELAAAYGDLLINGGSSQYAASFSAEGDTLREEIGPERRQARVDLLEGNGTIDFAIQPGSSEVVALATNEAGAIVAVSLNDVYDVKPNDGGNIDSLGVSGAVAGVEDGSTTTGVHSVYGIQLLFAVPPSTAADQTVRLLGFTQGLIEATEIE